MRTFFKKIRNKEAVNCLVIMFCVYSDSVHKVPFKKGECIMCRIKVLGVALVLCLSFLITFDALCTSTRYCGYAKLEDGSGNVVVSSGTTYADLSKDGYDKVQVETDNDTGSLTFLRAFIGKLERPYLSDSRVQFLFDIYADAKVNANAKKLAVYNSLVKLPNGTRRGIQTNGKYYIEPETIHFGVQFDSAGSRAIFMIDPGSVADITQNPITISQASLNQFYGNTANYLTPLQFSIDTGDPNQPIGWKVSDTNPHDQIAYYLFINQLNFKETGNNTWEITPGKGSVNLYVRDINNKLITLATYPSLPFKMVVQLQPFSSSAPSRNAIISQTWGEIKAR
jgi:hypothetical protein